MLQKTKTVAVTVTTGMASLQYESAQTIHKWSGIGDGHMSKHILLRNIMTNTNYYNVKRNIMLTDVLVLDEIGLLKADTLDDLEYICRHVRGNNDVFGGIQVIASGCFMQLPPVGTRKKSFNILL